MNSKCHVHVKLAEGRSTHTNGVNNRFHWTLIHQMAFGEHFKYKIAVKALKILCFCHFLFFVQYFNFVCLVILLLNDNLSDIRLKTKLRYCTYKILMEITFNLQCFHNYSVL